MINSRLSDTRALRRNNLVVVAFLVRQKRVVELEGMSKWRAGARRGVCGGEGVG
jgi:hypothetical protein